MSDLVLIETTVASLPGAFCFSLTETHNPQYRKLYQGRRRKPFPLEHNEFPPSPSQITSESAHRAIVPRSSWLTPV